MALSEAEYIELCKKQLEDKFSFGNGHGYTQKDLELLSNYIESEKDVSISLSTLKRLWKNDFKQGPQLATLNALVGVLDFKDWQHFKLQNKHIEVKVNLDSSNRFKPRSRQMALFLILPIIVSLAIVALKNKDKPKSNIHINGPVLFDVDKTLFRGVPNTAIFSYDLSQVTADSFFIQQSWNRWRRAQIDPAKNNFASIYYESGYHRAKLIANDSILVTQPVHVLSDGWEPHLYYDESDSRYIDFKEDTFVDNGMLHISSDLLSLKQIDIQKDFFTRVSNSKVFGVSSSDFQFKSRVKVDGTYNSNCPWLIVQIVTERHIFNVKLVRKGCEMNAAYKLGEIVKRGRDNDLSGLGVDIHDWQEIMMTVSEKSAQIIINGIPAFTETFKEDFGDIMCITYLFDGKGSIDDVKLSNSEGQTVFEDSFDR